MMMHLSCLTQLSISFHHEIALSLEKQSIFSKRKMKLQQQSKPNEILRVVAD